MSVGESFDYVILYFKLRLPNAGVAHQCLWWAKLLAWSDRLVSFPTGQLQWHQGTQFPPSLYLQQANKSTRVSPMAVLRVSNIGVCRSHMHFVYNTWLLYGVLHLVRNPNDDYSQLLILLIRSMHQRLLARSTANGDMFCPAHPGDGNGVVPLYNYSKDGTLGTHIRESPHATMLAPGKPLHHPVHLGCDWRQPDRPPS